jgi:hypothetical protein
MWKLVLGLFLALAAGVAVYFLAGRTSDEPVDPDPADNANANSFPDSVKKNNSTTALIPLRRPGVVTKADGSATLWKTIKDSSANSFGKLVAVDKTYGWIAILSDETKLNIYQLGTSDFELHSVLDLGVPIRDFKFTPHLEGSPIRHRIVVSGGQSTGRLVNPSFVTVFLWNQNAWIRQDTITNPTTPTSGNTATFGDKLQVILDDTSAQFPKISVYIRGTQTAVGLPSGVIYWYILDDSLSTFSLSQIIRDATLQSTNSNPDADVLDRVNSFGHDFVVTSGLGGRNKLFVGNPISSEVGQLSAG